MFSSGSAINQQLFVLMVVTTCINIYQFVECKLNEQKLITGDRFTKVIVNRKSKITLTISLRARIRAFHKTSPNLKSYDLRQVTSPITEVKKDIVSFI